MKRIIFFIFISFVITAYNGCKKVIYEIDDRVPTRMKIYSFRLNILPQNRPSGEAWDSDGSPPDVRLQFFIYGVANTYSYTSEVFYDYPSDTIVFQINNGDGLEIDLKGTTLITYEIHDMDSSPIRPYEVIFRSRDYLFFEGQDPRFLFRNGWDREVFFD